MASRIRYTTKEVDSLARLMKAEALGEGNFGMLLVGNVVVNRAVANCIPFKNIRTIQRVVSQNPGGFEAYDNRLYNAPVNSKIKDLALKNIKYWRAEPANRSLYFQNPGSGNPCRSRFWGDLSGRYKRHCFYNPDNPSACGL